MAFHHVALATGDIAAAHRFYTEAMGFRLVHLQAGVTDAPAPGGWAKHAFYDTGGGGLLALWDLHDPRVGNFDPAVSRGLGLPNWVNHIAFDGGGADDLEAKRDRWLAHGLDVLRIDHGWTISIYTDDPDGNLVEWCHTVRPFGEHEAERAASLLHDPDPHLDPLPSDIEMFTADAAVT
jgi:catechol 2,3-dioxygenase-like lactoylglutathione lyase family enzyme